MLALHRPRQALSAEWVVCSHLTVTSVVCVKDGIQDVDPDAIEHAPIFEILLGICRRVALAVLIPVRLVYLVPGLSPYRQLICTPRSYLAWRQLGKKGDTRGGGLTLVVGVEGRGIEYERHVRVGVHACVPVPQVAVDEAWLERPATCLHRPQESRDDIVEEWSGEAPDLVVGSPCLLFPLEEDSSCAGEVLLPRIRPPVLDRHVPVKRRQCEAELAPGRLPAPVKLRDHRGKRLDVGKSSLHVQELAEEEVYVRQGLVRSPGQGLRDEGRHDGVDGRHGRELGVHHAASSVTVCSL